MIKYRLLNSMILIVLFTTVISSCKKKDKDEPTPTSTPQPTSYLTTDVGGLINFNADLEKIAVDTVITNSQKVTVIDAEDNAANNLILSFVGRDTGTYLLTANSLNNSRFVIATTQQLYLSKPPYGQIKITKYDKVNGLISGSFEMAMRRFGSTQNDTIIMRNGVFQDLDF